MASVDDIRDQLKSLGLESRGNRATLKERLRKHLRLHPELKGSLSGQESDKDFEEEEEKGGGDQRSRVDHKEITHSFTTEGSGRLEGTMDDTLLGSDQTPSRTPPKQLHQNSRYDYYLCFDVEATCEKGFSFEFPNEVIEFPVVLLDGSTLEVVDEFQTYVRPTYRPTLSEFCVELTGIQQETVDAALTFTEMLVQFEEWLTKHGILLGEHPLAHLGQRTKEKTHKNRSNKHQKHPPKSQSRLSNNKNKGRNAHQETFAFGSPQPQHGPTALNDFVYGATFCFVCDGPFDIRDFIQKQCIHSDILRPSYFAKPFLDIRTLFREYFDLMQWLNLEGMLKFLGETFQGRQHSGICDARMVALIAKRLAQGFKSLPKSVRSIQEAKEKKTKRISQSGGNDPSTEMDSIARLGNGKQEQEVEREEEEGEDGDPIFREENQDKISSQWSVEKMVKISQGCVLKANRVIDPSIPARMIPFHRLERLGIWESEITSPDATFEDQDPRVDNSDESSAAPEEKLDDTTSDHVVITGLAEILTIQTSPLEVVDFSHSEDEEETQEDESFVQESRFAALMLE